MSTNELRKYLHKYIDLADASSLAIFYEIALKKLETSDDIVYYRAGKPITKNELYKELKEAEAEIEKGDYMTIEDFDKESAQWG